MYVGKRRLNIDHVLVYDVLYNMNASYKWGLGVGAIYCRASGWWCEILLHLNVKQDTDSFALEKQNIQQTQINDHKTKMSRAKNDHIYLIWPAVEQK